MPFASIPEAIELFRSGQMLIVVDDEDRENEGDLTLAAEHTTPEAINFMATHGRGLICLALAPSVCDQLDLRLMSPKNTSNFGTNFTESIDAAEGVTTGISAHDRAHTIQTAIAPQTTAQDLARPGHMFPLRAKEGGVLIRAGQTEAAVDLARLAGLRPGGVICEIMNPDGTMARVPELKEFARQHGLKIISVAALIKHRLQNESLIRRVTHSTIENEFGSFFSVTYESILDGRRHLALVHGDVAARSSALVRMHSQCIYGDVFQASSCDCHGMVNAALGAIAQEGAGVLVYLNPGSTGVRPSCPATAQPAPPAPRLPQHEIGIGAQILADLGLKHIRVLTNHPRKIVGLDGFGLEIDAYVALSPAGAPPPAPRSLPSGRA